MIYKSFDKKSFSTHTGKRIYSENQQLAEELHRSIIKTFEKSEVHSTFKDNIWGGDLENIQLISKCNKRPRFLLCVIDI